MVVQFNSTSCQLTPDGCYYRKQSQQAHQSHSDVITGKDTSMLLDKLRTSEIVKVDHHKSSTKQIKLDLTLRDGSRAWFKPMRYHVTVLCMNMIV